MNPATSTDPGVDAHDDTTSELYTRQATLEHQKTPLVTIELFSGLSPGTTSAAYCGAHVDKVYVSVVDTEALHIAKTHYDIVDLGRIEHLSPQCVDAIIAGHPKDTFFYLTLSPPCVDVTRLKGADAAGADGPSSGLRTDACEKVVQAFKRRVPQRCAALMECTPMAEEHKARYEYDFGGATTYELDGIWWTPRGRCRWWWWMGPSGCSLQVHRHALRVHPL